MKRTVFWLLALALWLVACAPSPWLGGEVTPAPTPTPLPTAVVTEKPTYTVQRGEVVDRLTFAGRVSPVDEAELGQATVDLQQAQSRYDVMADRSDVGMRPEAEALQQATLAYARAKAAYDRAVEQVGQHTYDVRSQQKRVALARLEVERLETGVDPRLEQAVAKAELDLADLQGQITDTLVLAQAEQGRPLPLTELTAAFPRCLGEFLLAICERGEDVTMVLRTASDE